MWKKPRPFLGVTKPYGDMNVDIVNVDPEKSGPRAGIFWRRLGGYVPFYEEHEVRISHRFSLDEWYVLSPLERAFHVACKRIERAIELHQASAQAVEMEKNRRNLKNARNS